jgi:RNA polymerase sigma-70 factor (ECF subfamily)
VIHLRDIEEFEYDQIATITGTSEAAARMACSRARNRVKEQLVKIINHGL